MGPHATLETALTLARTFVSSFLLPLVEGGALHVGRPIGGRELESLIERGAEREPEAVHNLALARARQARQHLLGAALPDLDATALRLGAAAHNLLMLAHPQLDGHPREQMAIAEATLPFVNLEPPSTAQQVVDRHTVLSRLPELTWSETSVRTVIGRFRYVGRETPAWLAAVPRLGRLALDSTRRGWLKDVGIPAQGRELWLALQLASPLGEALDPLRLDPAPAWERMLLALRFPALCRLAAERVLEVGLPSAGDALTAALLRFAAVRAPVHGQAPTPAALGFVVRFLAHAVWLGRLTGDGQAGPELATLLTAADRVDPRLVRPADVPPDGPQARDFAAHLAQLRLQAVTGADLRADTARALCARIAAG